MRARARATLLTALSLLLSLAGAVALVNTFGRADFHGNGLSFTTQITLLAPGETQLSLPPLGMVAARTHSAPVKIRLELRGLNPSLLRDLGTDPKAREEMLASTTARAQSATLKTALMALALAGLGSLGVALLLRKTGLAVLCGAFLLGCLFCGALLGWTYMDYDLDAMQQPRYEGMLESAPWVMSVLTSSFDGLARLGEGFAVMAKNLPRLSQQGQSGTPMSDVGEDLRVLHVSDIHNNTAAFDLIQSLVKNFRVNLVIDTGDLTDYGTPVEADLTANLTRLAVPYVFVPGNHDSPELIARLRRLRNIFVARGRIIQISGLRILAVSDPSAGNDTPGIAAEETLREAGALLLAKWQQAGIKPDIVAAHNVKMLESLLGLAPIALHGHDHRASLRKMDGTLIEDAGTTGAAGFRGLASEEDVPYTVDLQYWRKNEDGRLALVAVDEIAVDGLNGTLHVARTSVSPAIPAAAEHN